MKILADKKLCKENVRDCDYNPREEWNLKYALVHNNFADIISWKYVEPIPILFII